MKQTYPSCSGNWSGKWTGKSTGKWAGKWAATALMLVCANSARALTPLNDAGMSEVTGQDGVSIVMDGNWSAQSLNITQNEETLSFKGLSSQPVTDTSGASILTIDAMPDHVAVDFSLAPNEYRIDDITLGTGTRSFGGLRLFAQGSASLKLKPLPDEADPGVSLSGNAQVSNGAAYLRFNGYDMIAKGLRVGASFTDATLKMPLTADDSDIKLEFSNAALTAGFSSLSLDMAYGDPLPDQTVTPLSPDWRDPRAWRSFGALTASLNVSGSLALAAGGDQNQGIRLKPNVTWTDSSFTYTGLGVVSSSAFSGALSSTAGLTVGLEKDTLGSYVKFAAQDLSVSAKLGNLVIGQSGITKLGAVGMDLRFQDALDWKNWIKLRPGGDINAGSQGMTADVSWYLADGAAFITDNNNSVWLSGLQTQGTGRMTVDLTKSCSGTTVIPGCYAGTSPEMNKGTYNGHFDGLRLGFSNVVGSYSFEGLRVGTATSPVQGGTELLLFAGVYPAYDFVLNGHMTLLPGGRVGDGIGFNADLFLTKSNAGVSVDEYGKGLWLADMNQEMHYRDASIEASEQGVMLNKGEYWSKLNASEVRLGSKTRGKSFGRLMIKTYEENSTMSVATGGAGALCVGAFAATETGCGKAGGRWEDRGDEGLSVKLKTLLMRDKSAKTTTVKGVVTDEKRNQVLFETRRTIGADGPINGSGVQAVLDNFWTSDAKFDNPDMNTFGLNVALDVDVAPTIVKSKVEPFTKTTPLGFAVSGRLAFKEIGADRLQAVHPTTGAQTVVYGMRVQNADVRFNLTATPIN